uniref:hypothetical protein n=1 Tax=Angelakisella sp. TaxID=1935177 RepID=UPI0040285995
GFSPQATMASTMTRARAIARIFFIFFSSRKFCFCRAAGVAARKQLYYSNQPGRAQPYFSLFVEFARKQRGNLADLFCDSVNRRNGYWNGSCFSNKKRRKRVFRAKAGGGFVAAWRRGKVTGG